MVAFPSTMDSKLGELIRKLFIMGNPLSLLVGVFPQHLLPMVANLMHESLHLRPIAKPPNHLGFFFDVVLFIEGDFKV